MMPTKFRHPSCYFLEVGRKKILLDLGHTSIGRLIDQGIDLHSIDILFVSHFHTDHSLKRITKNADLLLIEAGYIKPTPNHFTMDQIIKLAESAKIKKTIATHLRDADLPILRKKIKNYKNIILAEDLMRIKI
jgi:ribonuclease BN (tRNA processing enzyme)